MSANDTDSAAWYVRNTQDYVERTQSVDLSHLYGKFLESVPQHGRILDAGCGSGRDSLAFQNLGYDVVPMDASSAMVEHATRLTGRHALHLRHQDVAFDQEFDGIWSMASMLHVPHHELADVLARYRTALIPSGTLFASFKHGVGERHHDDRLFAHQNDRTFRNLLLSVPGLDLIETWVEQDRRPGRQDEEWFSTLCRRTDRKL